MSSLQSSNPAHITHQLEKLNLMAESFKQNTSNSQNTAITHEIRAAERQLSASCENAPISKSDTSQTMSEPNM